MTQCCVVSVKIWQDLKLLSQQFPVQKSAKDETDKLVTAFFWPNLSEVLRKSLMSKLGL